MILLFLLTFATPNNSGFITLCKTTFAPFFNLVLVSNNFDKF